MKLLCWEAIWYIIPAIRKELAKILVKEHNLSQKEVAKLLGLSEAAVSYYTKNKRGGKIRFTQKEIKKLKALAKKLKEGKRKELEKGICELCELIQKKRFNTDL